MDIFKGHFHTKMNVHHKNSVISTFFCSNQSAVTSQKNMDSEEDCDDFALDQSLHDVLKISRDWHKYSTSC